MNIVRTICSRTSTERSYECKEVWSLSGELTVRKQKYAAGVFYKQNDIVLIM